MSLLIAKSLAIAYGPRTLFENASFTIGPSEKVGLIGPNGTGKSTLLKILSGEQRADTGSFQLARGARVGYLPQEVAELPDGPLVDVVLSQVPGRTALETRLAEVEKGLEAATDEAEQMELAQSLADLHAALDHFEERYGRHHAEAILVGLGFDPARLDRRVRELSGGWMMRVALASLLLQDPEMLLLDEPTNHLDVPTQEWFDDFLRQSQRAMVLICHDRQFLNAHIDRVLSLEPEGLRSYPGNYDAYCEARALEEVQLEAQAERQQAKRDQLQDFIDRFGAKATKARQAQSKQKALDKMEEVKVLEHRATLRFRFGEVPHAGKEVVKIEHLTKSFGPNVLYKDLSTTVLRGQRIGIVGANGAGKTTLMRLIAGELEPDSGKAELGHGVSLGYYAQHHFDSGSGAEGKKTVLETLWAMVPDRPESYVRSLAGMFLFSGDAVQKPIQVLSGGERARVALAKLLLVPRNLLLMDEPTNHLDLTSSEALIEALKDYEGTLIFVSHNHSFANQLASHIWDVGGGAVEIQPGNLDDHLDRVRRRAKAQQAAASGKAVAVPTGAPISEKDKRRIEAEARQALSAKQKPLRKELAQVEERVAVLEAEDKAAQAALADPAIYHDFEQARPHMDTHTRASAELEKLYARWEELQRLLADAPGATAP
jgi:ATP-binding cassette subfamily F protein 3